MPRSTTTRLIDALEPFAALVVEADPEDPIPARGGVHCLIYGGGDLGELDCADFHAAAQAWRDVVAAADPPSSKTARQARAIRAVLRPALVAASAYLAVAACWAWVAWPATASRPVAYRIGATTGAALRWPILAAQLRAVLADRHPSPTGDQVQ